MVDTIMVEMDPPFEVIVEAVRVDVLVVTKFAMDVGLDVFILPRIFTLLRLAVVTQLRYAVLT